MKQRTDICDHALFVLEDAFPCVERDLGSDARLSKWGLTFTVRVWDVEGIGSLCALRMRSVASIMQMETVVIAPTLVDLPLMNLDHVNALGNETQIVELYDTQIDPWPEAWQQECAAIGERDRDISDTGADDAHWYDQILYPCSYHKKAKGQAERLSNTATDYLVAYVDQLAQAAPCDATEKAAKVRAFAERLFAEGGPAVDMMTKLFGPQIARRLVVEHMYGVRES